MMHGTQNPLYLVEKEGGKMLLLNFTHPLTREQCAQIEALAGTAIEEVRTIAVQIEKAGPLEPQIIAIVEAAGLPSQEWQTRSLLINPPGYAPAAFVLLAELLNLQAVREEARRRR
jgi:hypothetical protein